MSHKYTSVLATETHYPVTKMKQFRPFDSFVMGFYLNRKTIGGGELKRARSVSGHTKTCLQTESVSLNNKFRRKGHGIHLYHHLIAHAKACGAERIYSSRHLNNRSRRMWEEKLPKFYKVVPVLNRRPCSKCGCRCNRKQPIKAFYIQFEEK